MKNLKQNKLTSIKFPLQRMIPSMITITATCSGITAIRFAIAHQFEMALIAIAVAACLDFLDGRMARLLNATSDFGAILDSLSDFLCFGVSPALIIYFWSLQYEQNIGWIITLFFAVCCSLRLARFNSSINKLPSFAYNYFQGVPAPAGAGICLLPIVAHIAWGIPLHQYSDIIAIWVFVAGLMSVSTIPTFSFKKMQIHPKLLVPLLVLIALVIASFVNRPWQSLSIFLLCYIGSIFISSWRYNVLKRKAQSLKTGKEALRKNKTANN